MEGVGTALRLMLKEHFVGTRPGGDDEVKAAAGSGSEQRKHGPCCVAPPGLPQGLVLTKHPECIAKLTLE